MTIRRFFWLPLLVAAFACTCGDRDTEKLEPAGSQQGRKLDPLPPVPQVKIDPEALPGADGSLQVVAARPKGEAHGNLRPTITFSKPIVSLGSVEEQAKLPPPATIEPPIPGQWKWLGSSSVELVPEGLIPYSTRYRVTVPAGLRAVDGSTLAEAYSWEFETPRPRLQQVEPYAGFLWLPATPTFQLLFDQPVQDLAARARFEVGGRHVAVQVVKETDVAAELRKQEEGRRYQRAAHELDRFRNRQMRYELKPAEPLPLDAAVQLVIDGELRGREGPLTLGNTLVHDYRTYGPMQVVKAQPCIWPDAGGDGNPCPFGPIVLITSNRAVAESLKGRLTLEPAAEIDWDRVEAHLPPPWMEPRAPYVVIPGRYKPGTEYTVKIAAGLADEHGQAAPAFEGKVRLDDRAPSFSAGSNLALLERGGDGTLPVETVNVDSLDVALWGLDAPQLARVLARGKPLDIPATRRLALDVSGSRNATRWTGVPLRQAFGDRPSGFFVARIQTPQLPLRGADTVIGQVTDLAVHSKLGPASGEVWVTSLSAGAPVADATLRLYDRDGREKWTGRTDADGLARVPGLSTLQLGQEERYRWEAPFALVVAEKGDDRGATLSTWMDGLSPSAFDLPSAWEGNIPDSYGLVFADRGIYRPGDKVHLKGLIRYRRLGELSTPGEGSKITLVVSTSRGDEVLRKEIPVTRFGTFTSELELGRDVPLGHWSVQAVAKLAGEEIRTGGSFRVEEYRAPQFQVDVEAPESAIAGEELRGQVNARYLFGGAMAGAGARWTLMRTSSFFTPPGNEGFVFGARTWWWDDEEPMPSTEVVGAGDGVTDVQGMLAVQLGKAEAPGEKSWEYTFEAEVTDVNRQRVANRAVTTVHPAAWYAGLRVAATGFAEAGKPVRLEAIAVQPDGARVKAPVAVVIERREWKSIRKKGAGGQWFTVSEPVEERVAGCELTTGESAVDCTFTPKEPGLYVLEATVRDGQGRRQVTRDSMYVVGGGWVSWQRNDTDRIDLVADKQLYEPGETAKILVKSPYPEAEAVITVEREGVLSARRVKLVGSAVTLEVPIDESLVPNAFVGVLLVRGRVAEGGIESGEDPGRPAARFGYVQLGVEKKSKRLTVSVAPDAAEKRPGQKVRVDLQVKDFQGGGVPAELTVWAVDEGVLRLTGYELPDPVEAIWPRRGLSTRIGEPLLHLVQRRLYGEKGQTAGGGGGREGAGFRTRFKTTVLFAPEVIADAGGRAFVEFELPDNLTTFRIMAVAVGEDDRFGGGESKITVAKPLLALPALPRLARVGDRFEAGVVVHQKGIELPSVRVEAEAEGLRLDGPAVQDVALAGRPREVRFAFVAEKPGTATLRFRVEGGGESDGVEQKLPVQLPVAFEAVALYGDTVAEKIEKLETPGGIRPEVGGLEITMASTAMGGFDENMEQLVDYPYGCLEQMASRLTPFVALRELSGAFGIPWNEETAVRWIGEGALRERGSTDPDVVVRETVRAIERLQNVDGGYRYWSSSPCSAQYASAYAVLGLARAKEVGYPVDAQGLNRGKRYLADVVAAGQCERCGFGCTPPDDTVRTFALWVLARTGAAKPSYYGEIYGRRNEMPLFARAMLADAMFVGGGDRGQARALLTEILNYAKESGGQLHFEEEHPETYAALWSSDTRTTAIVLSTLLDVSPDHPYVPKLARYLTTVRGESGRYRNTQEAAFSLVALTELVRTKERDVPDFTARVRLAGQELASRVFRGRSMEVVQEKIPMSRLGGGGELAFSKTGKGVLYYGALLRYAPAEVPMTPLDRGFTVQRWFEPYEGGGQARRFFAGELVRVRVRIASNQERHFAAISVPLPAGLEPVDTSLASTAQLPVSAADEGPGAGYEYESAEDLYGAGEPEDFGPFAESFYSPFNHTEQRDDRVTIFADQLPPGVHVASFVARATTPGTYVLQPAHAEEMYAPEVFGRSDGGTFEVALPSELAAR